MSTDILATDIQRARAEWAERELARAELRIEHARKQGAADGFQDGWHAAIARVREHLDELSALIPSPRGRTRP